MADVENGWLTRLASLRFDRGFWSISDDYRVLVRDRLFDEGGAAELLLKPKGGQPILLPKDRRNCPAPQLLDWHRRRHAFGSA